MGFQQDGATCHTATATMDMDPIHYQFFYIIFDSKLPRHLFLVEHCTSMLVFNSYLHPAFQSVPIQSLKRIFDTSQIIVCPQHNYPNQSMVVSSQTFHRLIQSPGIKSVRILYTFHWKKIKNIKVFFTVILLKGFSLFIC